MSRATPMDPDRRIRNYLRANRSTQWLTPRQERRIKHKNNRSDARLGQRRG